MPGAYSPDCHVYEKIKQIKEENEKKRERGK